MTVFQTFRDVLPTATNGYESSHNENPLPPQAITFFFYQRKTDAPLRPLHLDFSWLSGDSIPIILLSNHPIVCRICTANTNVD